MAHDQDGQYQPNAKARKQAEKDQRRMEYRRAIESYCDHRELLRSIADFSDTTDITVWQQPSAESRKNAPQAR